MISILFLNIGSFYKMFASAGVAADCSVSAADCPVSAGDCSFILSGIRGRTQRTLIPKSFNNNFLDPGNDLWFCFPGSSGIPDKYFYDCILLKKLIIPNCISKITHTHTVCVPYYKAAPYNISHTKIFSRRNKIE